MEIEKNIRKGLSTSSRPFDAYDRFHQAEGHESFDRLRILSTSKDKKRVPSYDDTLFALKWLPRSSTERTKSVSELIPSYYRYNNKKKS